MNTQNIDDGGPAFPQSYMQEYGDDGRTHIVTVPGMSLRDWFAGRASETDIRLFQEQSAYVGRGSIAKYTREEARFRFSDAMLRARKGGAK